MLPLVALPFVNSVPFEWWFECPLPCNWICLFVVVVLLVLLLLLMDGLLFKALNILAELKSATKSVSGVNRFLLFFSPFEAGGGRWNPFVLLPFKQSPLVPLLLLFVLPFGRMPLLATGAEMWLLNRLLLSLDDSKSIFHRLLLDTFWPFMPALDVHKLLLFSSIDLAVPFVNSVALFNCDDCCCCFCDGANWAVFVIDFSGLAGSK